MKKTIQIIFLAWFLLPLAVWAQANSAMCDQLRNNIEIAESSGLDQSAIASARRTYNGLCSGGSRSESRRSGDDDDDELYEHALREANKPIDENYVKYFKSGERFTCDPKKLDFCCADRMGDTKKWVYFDSQIEMFEEDARRWLSNLRKRNLKTEAIATFGRGIWQFRNEAAYLRREKERVCSQVTAQASPTPDGSDSSAQLPQSSSGPGTSSRKPQYVSCVKMLPGFKPGYNYSKTILQNAEFRFRNDCNEYALTVVCSKRNEDFSNPDFRHWCTDIYLKSGETGSATLDKPRNEGQGGKARVSIVWKSCLGSDNSCHSGLINWSSAMRRSETGKVD